EVGGRGDRGLVEADRQPRGLGARGPAEAWAKGHLPLALHVGAVFRAGNGELVAGQIKGGRGDAYVAFEDELPATWVDLDVVRAGVHGRRQDRFLRARGEPKKRQPENGPE